MDTAIDIYGVSICTNAWGDVHHRPLMNIMMSCPVGNVFFGLIDTSRKKKTMVHIVDQLKAL